MFNAEKSGDGKWVSIRDDASDLALTLDTDDVNPEDVNDEAIERIVAALDRAFYGFEGQR